MKRGYKLSRQLVEVPIQLRDGTWTSEFQMKTVRVYPPISLEKMTTIWLDSFTKIDELVHAAFFKKRPNPWARLTAARTPSQSP